MRIPRSAMPFVPAFVSAMAAMAAVVAGFVLRQPALFWLAPALFAVGLVFSVRRYNNVVRAAIAALEATGNTDALRRYAPGELAAAIERLHKSVHQKEREAQEQNRTLSLLLDNLGDGVIATDQAGIIVSLNRSACRLLGAEPARLLGADVRTVLRHAELHDVLDEALARALGPAQTIEVPLHVPGGRRELLVRVAGVHNAEDLALAGLLVLRDVTDVRRLEGLRRDFVANVSHELKTPVTSIRGAAETLASGALADPEAGPRFVLMIERQSARLQQIIEDLLQLARIERIEEVGRGLADEVVDVAELVRRAAEAAGAELERYRRRMRIEVPAGLQVCGDAGLLEQALVNLISNAARYGGDEPEIACRVRREAGGDVRIEVVDRGPGIPREHLPRVFERFYRVDQSRSREVGGTGLGLAIVKHIAALHRGRVGVDSRPGEGSTFWIELREAV